MVQCILEGEYSERQADRSTKGGKNMLQTRVPAQEQKGGRISPLRKKSGPLLPISSASVSSFASQPVLPPPYGGS